MTLSLAEAGLLILSFAVPLILVVLAMPPYLKALRERGRVVDDVHKVPPTKVPFPAGPLLFLGLLSGEVAVYLSFGSLAPVAVASSAGIAFIIGFTDDLYVLGGRTKPVLLLFAAAPLVALALFEQGLYQPVIAFPLLGDTSPHFLIYTALVIVSFPIVANAFNMMDSFNGQVSWFTVLTSGAVVIGVVLHAVYTPGYSWGRVASALPLLAVGLGFLVFNRYPSKAFDGDSGSLMFGSTFAALAIVGGVEIAAMIAVVPAILNSFYTLSSVRGFVERRKMSSRPIYIGEDGKLYASPDKGAPNTLIRLILLGGPLTEREVVGGVVALTSVACLFSVVISILTWVPLS